MDRKSPSGYTFQGFTIPARMAGGIDRWIEAGIPPGHFLAAVICNDLRDAIARADAENLANLPAYIGYFHNEAPSACWGSPKKFAEWARRFIPLPQPLEP